MQFKNINEQLDIFISILEKNTELMDMLDYISKLNLPNFYIASGSIYQTMGITKENGEIKVYAPCGLSDIFSKTIRPLKHNNNYKELYNRKIENLKNRFDNLNIIEW